jgi:hypothetical protein
MEIIILQLPLFDGIEQHLKGEAIIVETVDPAGFAGIADGEVILLYQQIEIADGIGFDKVDDFAGGDVVAVAHGTGKIDHGRSFLNQDGNTITETEKRVLPKIRTADRICLGGIVRMIYPGQTAGVIECFQNLCSNPRCKMASKKAVAGFAMLLITGTLQAKSGFYAGADLLTGAASYEVKVSGEKETVDFSSVGLKTRFGWAQNEMLRYQVYLQGESYNRGVFADEGDVLGEFGVEAMALFGHDVWRPYLLGGVGFSWLELDERFTEDVILGELIKVGGGILFEVTPRLELLAGIDLQYRTWQPIEVNYGAGAETLETMDLSRKFYVGINVRF